MNEISGLLGKLQVGDGVPVRIMGILNLSPESFYKKSVVGADSLGAHAASMIESGADVLDVGGMSTAPYKDTIISAEEEISRLVPSIKALSGSSLDVPVSADTRRKEVAERALAAGATIINDVSSKKNPDLYRTVAEYGASLIVLPEDKSTSSANTPASPWHLLSSTVVSLGEKVDLAVSLGVERSKILVDPGIGFVRESGTPWYELDSLVIANLQELRRIGRPLLVGVSRKSFIGKILGLEDPSQRLYGSLAAAAVAVFNGAHVIRTHDVAETRQATEIARDFRMRIKK